MPSDIKFFTDELRDARGRNVTPPSDPNSPFPAKGIGRIVVDLGQIWPLATRPDDKSAILILSSGERAARVDYFCSNKSLYDRVEQSHFIEKNDFYVAPALGNRLGYFLSKPSLLFFGNKLIASFTDSKLLERAYPNQNVISLRVKTALTSDILLSIIFNTAAIPESSIADFFRHLEASILSWIVQPSPFVPLHSNPNACDGTTPNFLIR